MTGTEDAVREAVDAWVAGWCVSRGAPQGQPVDGGWQVDTGTAEEPLRVVLSEPTPSRVAAMVDRDLPVGTVLKLPGDPDDWRALVPDGWELLGDVAFMTRDVGDDAAGVLPDEYVLRSQEDVDRQVKVQLVTQDGEVAASGQVGVADGWGVPDRIATDSSHRRRGLGTALMSALTDEARQRGATSLVLGATGDGVALYEHLGWTRLAPMAAFRLADPRPGHAGTWRQNPAPT